MDKQARFAKRSVLALSLATLTLSPAFAAKLVDLSKQSITGNAIQIEEIKRYQGPNNTTHIRVQQTYNGFPVWGADASFHFKSGLKPKHSSFSDMMATRQSAHGFFYAQLSQDLASIKAPFSSAQSQKAMQHAKDLYLKEISISTPTSNEEIVPLIFVTSDGKPHYAYKVSFYTEPTAVGLFPSVPSYILDATTFEQYLHWNAASASMRPEAGVSLNVLAGGVGGNNKTGMINMDGLPGNQPPFLITRDSATGTCYMSNTNTRLKVRPDFDPALPAFSFSCAATDPSHNNIFWVGANHSLGGAYSTTNDAYANATRTRKMFNEWYGVEPIVDSSGKPTYLAIQVDLIMSGAILGTNVLSTGVGMNGVLYPATTPDIISHELAHGITNQTSKLGNVGQAGALNEAFADMAAKAFEIYTTGTNRWTFGEDNYVAKGKAIRYIDVPSKDCTPGAYRCSIENMSQVPSLSPYQAWEMSGVYRRAYYLMSTAPGWNARKTFDVAMHANMHYWVSTTDFTSGACTFVKAARDYGYDLAGVTSAFDQVGISTTGC